MENKVAIVTGASRGIGRAIALKFAKEGYSLAISCKNNIQQLEKNCSEIKKHNVDCITFCGDMGNENDVNTFFDSVIAHYGKIDCLVNNAGISHIGLLQDMTSTQWNNIINTNLSSVFYTCRKAVPEMLKFKSGKILSISSVWGNVGASMEVAYSASKGGVNSFTKALAKELAPSNIQVNAIACGMVDTDMNKCFSDEDTRSILEEIPAGRMASCNEVADFAFQIINKSDYLTGQIITFDGGWI